MKPSYFDGMQNRINARLDLLPNAWRKHAKKERDKLALSDGYLYANGWLDDLTEPLRGLLNIAKDDDDIKALADDLAFRMREQSGRAFGDFFNVARVFCREYAVNYPAGYEDEGIVLRLSCKVWWLRKLRGAHAKARELAARDAGIVHRGHDLYVSDDTMERRTQQLKRNAKLLEGVRMQSESGQVMALGDIAGAGMANVSNRFKELITRAKGFEELRIKYGHAALFITITCPSAMHAINSDGHKNRHFEGVTPCVAQAYLVKQWSRCRASLARAGCDFYGLRVVEPHHDGTPHWHMILFCEPKMTQCLQGTITHYFLDTQKPQENGAKENRVKFVTVEPSKGSVIGYLIKYLSKNLGGERVGRSDESENVDAETAAARVEAWASTWRIRQFQQVGGHSVSVWRELRRVDCDKIASDTIMRGWLAAQREDNKHANFAHFIEAMGGLRVKPREGLIKLDDDFVWGRGIYGEAVKHVVRGVCERFGFAKSPNNRERWVKI